jgi:hypothetical protein
VCSQVRDECDRSPKPITAGKPLAARTDYAEPEELPDLKPDHLRMLTDSCGVLVHAPSTVPDRFSGYRLDANARALIAVLMDQDHINPSRAADSKQSFDERLDVLANRYRAVLQHAFNRDTGRFRSHMSYDRIWGDEQYPFNEDSHARVVHALGESVARSHRQGHRRLGLAYSMRPCSSANPSSIRTAGPTR